MKRKQLAAIMLAAIMAVSACVPVNGISAAAAENAGAESTEASSVVEVLNEAAESVTEEGVLNAQEEATEAPAEKEETSEASAEGAEEAEDVSATEEAVDEAALLVSDGNKDRIMHINAHVLYGFAVFVLAVALHDLAFLDNGLMDETKA